MYPNETKRIALKSMLLSSRPAARRGSWKKDCPQFDAGDFREVQELSLENGLVRRREGVPTA
jgi:hypothetical protein